MNCLSCGRKIPDNILYLVGIDGHIPGLCEHCTRLVWAGSMDAQTVVNSLIYHIGQLNKEIEDGLQSVPGLFGQSRVTHDPFDTKPGVLQNFDDELLGTHFKENCCGSDDC